jgi:predicted glutamine amidotransferase
MCRWIAYSGPSIYLDELMVRPENSLIEQSKDANKAKSAINADGFGIGWYASQPQPGLFRDVYPAWNDENLLNVCQQIRSHLFFGHVRASTGSAINRSNCHPFRHENLLFMHNGQIGGFEKIRRELAMSVQPEFYSRLQGTTDSELLFFLAVGNGLKDDPEQALAKTVSDVLEIMAANKITEPLRLTTAVSDGDNIYAVRFATDAHPPSLFYGTDTRIAKSDSDCLILSEPLDEVASSWAKVPPSSFLTARDGHVEVRAFNI